MVNNTYILPKLRKHVLSWFSWFVPLCIVVSSWLIYLGVTRNNTVLLTLGVGVALILILMLFVVGPEVSLEEAVMAALGAVVNLLLGWYLAAALWGAFAVICFIVSYRYTK